MKTTHTIINGDCRKMQKLEDNSVDLVVTSPPYWQLKDYGSDTEIGYYDSYESYINHLNLVWQETFRVLNNGCRLCVDIGDQYARTTLYGRYKIIPIRTEIIRFCETIGFDYMGAIIWQKASTVNTSGGAVIMGSFPYPKNGIVKLDYEFILLFKKPGTPKPVDKEMKKISRMTKEEWNKYFFGHWNFPGEKQSKHLAMFPKELPHRLIKMFTFVGETVLDPFAGSGTTSLAAMELNRNSVGYEINKEFIPIIKEKLSADTLIPMNESEFNFTSQELEGVDFEEEIKKLPYIFKDPVKLEKRADPKQHSYGSKIDKNSKKRETYYRVKEIISPETILLKDGTLIKLIGIKEDPKKRNEAMAFLKEKLIISVFIKSDPNIPDETANGNAVPRYLYLKNKTNINAHLLRRKLVFLDDSTDFKQKVRFTRYSQEEEEF